jgi:hypothetical protein
MCVKQQVKRKLYVEFRVTSTEILYFSNLIHNHRDKYLKYKKSMIMMMIIIYYLLVVIITIII